MEAEGQAVAQFVRALQVGNLWTALFLCAVVWGFVEVVARVAGSLARATPSHRLTIRRIETLVTFLLYVGGGVGVAVTMLSPQPELLLALAGSAAVAVGFSLKDVVASVFAGLILLFDQPFQVGDRVRLEGEYGDVVRIGLRSVKLLTLGHDTVTIPNSAFLTGAVASGNSGSLSMMVTTQMHIAVGADVQRAVEVLHDVVATSRFAWLGNGIGVGVEEVVGETLVPVLRLTARCYVVDVRFEKDFATDVTVRATEAFRQAGIARVAPAQLD